MYHDGTAPAVKPQSSTTLLKITMRSMIHWFICQGYNISLLNSLECRDTKVR
jgi:SOS-response transcriptional repressor LexA